MGKHDTKFNTEVLNDILNYIDKNLDREICLDDLAAYSGYSKYHLNRVFSERVGCTIYKYIQHKRLQQAARRLTESNDRIIDIAGDAGYSSQQAFTLAFGKLFQLTPQQYRIRRKNRMYLRLSSYRRIYGRMAA